MQEMMAETKRATTMATISRNHHCSRHSPRGAETINLKFIQTKDCTPTEAQLQVYKISSISPAAYGESTSIRVLLAVGDIVEAVAGLNTLAAP